MSSDLINKLVILIWIDGSRQVSRLRNQCFFLFPTVGPYPNPCCCLHGACKYCIATNASWSLPEHHQRGKLSTLSAEKVQLWVFKKLTKLLLSAFFVISKLITIFISHVLIWLLKRNEFENNCSFFYFKGKIHSNTSRSLIVSTYGLCKSWILCF